MSETPRRFVAYVVMRLAIPATVRIAAVRL